MWARCDNAPVTSQETLPEDVAALRALVLTAWAERDTERVEKTRLAEQNDRLRHLIRQLQRMQFGRRSERLDPDCVSAWKIDPGRGVIGVQF